MHRPKNSITSTVVINVSSSSSTKGQHAVFLVPVVSTAAAHHVEASPEGDGVAQNNDALLAGEGSPGFGPTAEDIANLKAAVHLLLSRSRGNHGDQQHLDDMGTTPKLQLVCS